MAVDLSPIETRAQDLDFVRQCSLTQLEMCLPLRWPTPPDTPPSPKRTYRSHYVYLGWEDLRDPTTWKHLSGFDLVLRLVDFGGLRPVLAQRLGWLSGRGWCPFDPISIFLLIGWQITNNWTRAETLRHLHDPRYADYAQRFGFKDEIFPTEGGVRYFLTALGRNSDAEGETIVVAWDNDRCIEVAVQYLNQLIAQSVALIREASLLSPEAWQKALLCPDGMIHDAASRMRCASVQASCYESTTLQEPRPFPPKKMGAEAVTVTPWPAPKPVATPPRAMPKPVSSGTAAPISPATILTNPPIPLKPRRSEAKVAMAIAVYRSNWPTLPVASTSSCWMISKPPTSERRIPTAALLLQLSTFYPDLHLDAVAGDASFGYDVAPRAAYQLGAKRVIDLRAHSTDKDKALWPIRGYDDKGRAACPFGYAFTANGFDSERQRHKWFCDQACLKGLIPVAPVDGDLYPPNECPFQTADHPHGKITNVGQRFTDGSIRLVRDIPVGTASWKRLYHRARNASEGRNATLEGWGFKRLPLYGLPRGKALIFLADVWSNLTTLARLVREATIAAGFT